MAAQSPQTQVAQLPQSISAENPHAGLPIPLPSQSTSSRNVQLASPNSSQQNTSRPSTPKSHNGCQSWQRDDRVQFSTQGGYLGSQSQARSQIQHQAGYQQPWGNNQRQLLSGIEYQPLRYQGLYYNRNQLPTAPGYPSKAAPHLNPQNNPDIRVHSGALSLSLQSNPDIKAHNAASNLNP